MLLASCTTESVITPPPVRPLTKNETAIVTADNTFGLGLFRSLDREKRTENVIVSPLSISMALGMTLNGARGATADSMRATLALHGLGQEEINASYRTLIDLLRSVDPKVTFEIANSIWHRPELAVLPSFIDVNRQYFDAEVNALDFDNPDAKKRINDWVSASTHGKIPTIIEEIPREVVMYLINALYFKGSWTTQFDPDSTKRAEFTLEGGAKKPVDLMFRSGKFKYHRDEMLQAVDLPYGFDRYTMTVLLPKEGLDMASVVDGLDDAAWSRIVAGLDSADGMVFLPKVKLAWEETLNDWLERMGMSIAFSSNADFTGIDSDGGLAISEVRHKTFVEINEEGTEAAAVTSVAISRTSAPERFMMRMDRPYIFVIREKSSGVIMFIGKVMDPSA
jgi:serine protease inhibitor